MNNLAAICIVAFMLAWSGAPDAAQNTKDSKTAKPGVSAKNGGKRVAVSYKKNGAKTVKKAAASAAAAAAAVSAAEVSGTMAAHGPDLKSSNALVFDVSDGTVLYGKNTSHVSAIASITSSAPKALAIRLRSGDTSRAITRAPMATASCVAESPTGPCPKMAMVSPPCRPTRLRAP